MRAVTETDTIWSGLWHFTTEPLIADFTVSDTLTVAGTEIQFTDLSTGNPTSWEWDFDDDSTIDSYEQNPTWTYTTRGYYSVKLCISDGLCENTEIKEDYISLINSSPTLQNPLVI